MNYAEARSFFKNGDIVFFRDGKKNLVRRLITWFSRGPYYHVGIAFWMTDGINDRLMLAESQPDGYRIISLSAYSDRGMMVVRNPIRWRDLSDRVIGSAGVVAYDFLDLLKIGLKERFGITLPSKFTGVGEVCSVMVSKALRAAGFDGTEELVSPQKLFEALNAHRVFSVQGK